MDLESVPIRHSAPCSAARQSTATPPSMKDVGNAIPMSKEKK